MNIEVRILKDGSKYQTTLLVDGRPVEMGRWGDKFEQPAYVEEILKEIAKHEKGKIY